MFKNNFLRSSLKNIIFSFAFITIFLLLGSSSFAAPVITINSPVDNNYYWNNFNIDASTDINSNCTYNITATDGSLIDNGVLSGDDSTSHSKLISYSSLPHGKSLIINVFCYNSTNSSENSSSSVSILSDLSCGDSFNGSWTLGHDLNCSATSDNSLYLLNNTFLDCNNFHIITADGKIGFVIDSAHNITATNCNMTSGDFAFSFLGANVFDVTITNNYFSMVNNGVDITLSSPTHDIIISNNDFFDVPTIANIHPDSDSYNFVFDNNYMKGFTDGLFLWYFHDANISNNIFTEHSLSTAQRAIHLKALSGSSSSYINVHDNSINNMTYLGLILSDISSNIKINIYNNMFYNISSDFYNARALLIDNVASPALINMTGNTFTASNNPNDILVEVNNTDSNSLIFYHNKLYGTSAKKFAGPSNLFLDYNGEGNYWGYPAHTCPGFIPGIDSNDTTIIDRYSYTDSAFTDPACSCGDSVTNSTKLYNDIISCSSKGLLIINNNIDLDCDGHKITVQSSDLVTETGIFVSSVQDVNISNCILESTNSPSTGQSDYGIYLSGANNTRVYNNTLNGFGRSTFDYDLGAVVLSGANNNKIIGNNFGIGNINGIVLLSNSNNNDIINNIINFDLWEMGSISIVSSSDNNLDNNTLYKDIILTHSINTLINNSKIIINDGTSYGIHVKSSNYTRILNSIINSSRNEAIYVENIDGLGASPLTNLSLINNIIDNTNSFYKTIKINSDTTINNLVLKNNKIYSNSESGGLFVSNNVVLNNPLILNNYWGHDECPLFLYGRDTNLNGTYDHYPLNSIGSTISCNGSITFKGIYLDDAFTTPIANNYLTPWYYYYNGSKMRLLYEIIPANYKVEDATLSDSNNYHLVPLNNNRTLWAVNLTLTVDYDNYLTDPHRPVHVTYYHYNSGPLTTAGNYFYTIININPINNKSVAYTPFLDGDTTDWSTITDFTNVTNLVFEKKGLGKIIFNEPLNLLDSAFLNAINNLRNRLLFDKATIGLDAVQEFALLNKSATIIMNLSAINGFNKTAFNVSLLASKIKMNNEICTVCSNINYDNSTGLINFTVPHWTTYKVDLEAPVITSSEPSGTLLSSTTETTLKVSTNEEATCKYDTSDKEYANMSFNLTTTDGLTHKKIINVSSGHTYTFYVRCKDNVNNIMNSSHKITFNVASTSSGGGGGGGNVYFTPVNSNSSTTFTLSKYSTVQFILPNKQVHRITLKELGSTKALFGVYSTEQLISLKEGESKLVDFNNDGTADIKLTLKELRKYSVLITVIATNEKMSEEKTNEEIKENKEKTTTNEEKTETKELTGETKTTEKTNNKNNNLDNNKETEKTEEKTSKKNNYLWAWLIGIILIIVVIIGIVKFKKK